jgi:hypothetical protein
MTSDGDCNYLTEPFVILGEESQLFSHYRIFPVPADRQIRIVFNVKGRSHRIFIYDAIGQKVMETAITEDESVIDVQKIKDGIYFVDADGHKSKIVVSH